MAELPPGTVTMLFTDIEGSTRLLQELGRDRYVAALEAHRRLLREAFSARGGVEVEMQGDSFHFAFASAGEAVCAAAEGQRALASFAWPDAPIHVRIGLHTGEPLVSGGLYAGLDVHRAARVMQAAHGEQVLLSRETADLVAGEPPNGLSLRDLGEHRLKDLLEAQRLYQLMGEGLAPDFPPLKTISNTNLPRPASSFVGRRLELLEVSRLLRNGARLVTLTGPGGTGKTRLAIEAAAELVPEFRAGVFWVPLASLRDPSLVSETIAQALGAKDGLVDQIGEGELLLLLDNFEQVVDAAPELGGLLETCPNLKLIVTSRELLRIGGEVPYIVPPLAEAEAVALFHERARTKEDTRIAELCRRLDNLPLAVELAAARAGVLTPAQMLERLSKRLDLLKGGRDAAARQQTLRAAIEWSYDLLTGEEQRLFGRLAAFAGGFTLEAAEDVAGADLDLLESLVDKSLVSHSEVRFSMLETIKEFALERLELSGEAEEQRRQHAEYFLAYAEAQVSFAVAEEQFGAFRAEQGNFRAALSWLRQHGLFELELRLASALADFWWSLGYLAEGRAALEGALARSRDVDSEHRRRALGGLAMLAYWQGDYERALGCANEAVRIARAHGDRAQLARALNDLGMVFSGRGDDSSAIDAFEEAAAAAEEPTERARSIVNVAYLKLQSGDAAGAAADLAGALADLGDDGDPRARAIALFNLGLTKLELAADEEAEAAFRKDVELVRAADFKLWLAYAFVGLAAVSARRGAGDRAALLVGAADAITEAIGGSFEQYEESLRARTVDEARTQLGDAAFDHAIAAGRELALEEAVEQALSSE